MKTFLFLTLLIPSITFANGIVPAAFSTNFEESITSVATGKEKKSFGKIDYKFPGHIRYEVTSPEESASIFVTNNKTSWYYRPPFVKGEQGEVTIQKATNLPLTKFLDSMKSGFENSKHMTHKYDGNKLVLSFSKEAQKDTHLKEVVMEAPKPAKDVKSLKEFEKITLVYDDGRKVNLKFVDFQENADFKPGHFEFKVPEKTKVTNN